MSWPPRRIPGLPLHGWHCRLRSRSVNNVALTADWMADVIGPTYKVFGWEVASTPESAISITNGANQLMSMGESSASSGHRLDRLMMIPT